MALPIVKKAKNTAMLTSVLVCMLAPLLDENQDWNTPVFDQPGGPHRYTNRTRNIKHVSATYGRRTKRPREITQPTGKLYPTTW